jgi:hypothetical protein
MTNYRRTDRKDWIDVTLRLVLMFLAMLAGVALLGPANLALWPLPFLIPMIWLIVWHTRNFAYHCQNCGQTFEISVWHNMLTPHSPDGKGGGWKVVKCPRCKVWHRAEVLRIERQ